MKSIQTFSVTLFLLLSFLVANQDSFAQVIPDYDLGGASKPKPFKNLKAKEGQYKRTHQNSLRSILLGKFDDVETFLNEFLEKNPSDAETLFMLGILHGQKGELDKAEDFMKQAIQAKLPPGRLIAGPRSMTKPLAKTDLMIQLNKEFETKLVHGPLLGNVSDSGASFWVRTATECDISVTATESGGEASITSNTVRSKSTEDFTAVATITGLKPNTVYRYQVSLNGKPTKENNLEFHTLKPKGESSKFKIAFGGGAGYVPENERMWNTIGDQSPDAILLLGDNVYIDDPESVAMQQYTYQRRQSRPEWRKLTARTPVFTIWDDHDFGTNDSWGGADIDKPFWKKDWVFPIFRQNWANPGYGGGDEQPGCWYKFHIGDVDFIMLDCRYYRTSPKSKSKSMLGPVQKAWLKQQLLEADGTFKVLCSSVPWDFRTKGDSRDTWNGYKKEHEEILGFIDEHKIEGVVLMSADRHRSDCWKLSRPNGYDLYDFNSSRLTNQHIHATMEKQGAIFSFNDPQSFGVVEFDTTVDDPTTTYTVVDINGKKPHTITVKRSELKK